MHAAGNITEVEAQGIQRLETDTISVTRCSIPQLYGSGNRTFRRLLAVDMTSQCIHPSLKLLQETR